MRKVAVVTDSSANLPADVIDRHHIFVVPVLLYMDGREYRDGVDIEPSEVFRYMRDMRESTNGKLPRTATPTIGEFFRVYTMAAQEAEEIVSIHLSAKLSAVVQVACAARDLVSAHVRVMDSHTAAMGCGFAVLEAARLAEAGADADMIVRRVREVASRARVLAVLSQLDYLHRGGHVPAVAALVGAALKICPILTIAEDQARVVELPRTRRRAIERVLRRLDADVGGRPVHIAVMHAGVPAEAEQLHEQVIDRFSCVETFITEFTPVMGSHTGPGLLGVAYYVSDFGVEDEQTLLP